MSSSVSLFPKENKCENMPLSDLGYTTESFIMMLPERDIKSTPTPSNEYIKSLTPSPSEENIQSLTPTPSEEIIKILSRISSEESIYIMTPTPSEENIYSLTPTPSEDIIKSLTPTPSEDIIKSLTPTPSEDIIKSLTPTPSEDIIKSLTPTPSEEIIKSLTPSPSEEIIKSLTPSPSEEIIKSLTPSPSEEIIKSLTPSPSKEIIKSLIPTPSEEIVKSLTPTPSEEIIKSLTPTPSEEIIKSLTPTPSEEIIKSLTPTPSEEIIKSLTPTPSEEIIKSLTPTPPVEIIKSLTPTPSEEIIKSLTPTPSEKIIKSLTPTPPVEIIKSLTPTPSEKIIKSLTPTPSEKIIKSLTPTPPEENIKSLTPTPSEKSIKSLTPTPPEENIKSATPTASEENIKSLTITPPEQNIKSLTPTLSEENVTSQTLTTSGGNRMSSNNITNGKQLSVGLPNFGNTCYINSSLQFLFTAEAFGRELSDLMDNCMDRPESKFLSCFVKLWKMRNNLEDHCRIHKDNLLMDLINEFIGINPDFAISDGNSALTFLCQCLKQMEETGQKMGWQKNSSPRCPVGSNFKIKMKKVITCSRCIFQQSILKEMNYISLPLVHNSVDQCLSSIVNNRQPFQNKCQMCRKHCVSYFWTFHTLPKFLILYLQREALNKNDKLIKLNNPVDIQPQLRINTKTQSCNGYTHQQSVYLLSLSQIYKPQKENSKAEARNNGDNIQTETTSTYRLISVLNYIGRKANDGHFLTDCYTHSPPQWWTCNDEFITLTTEKDVLQRRLLNAYLLLYERVSTG